MADLRQHSGAIATFTVAGALACAGAVYVFLWLVRDAQSSAMVPGTLDLWTMGNLVTFILNAAFWELLFVGVPATLVALAGWMWWRRLPDHEKTTLNPLRGSRPTHTSAWLPLLLFFALCIKVYLDGNWNVAIGTFTVDYVIGSVFAILEWGLFILAVPSAVALVWWIQKGTKV